MLDFLSGLPLVDLGMDLFKQDRSEQMQEDQQNFNADQATAARGWQEYMRGSAYQATVDDMKKAGLNPMLAYSQGASATPGTNTASSGIASTPPRTGTITAGVQTAAQVENIQAQTEKLRAETAVVKDSIIERDESGEVKVPKTWENRLRHHMGDREWYEAKNALEKVYLTKEEAAYVTQEIKNAITRNEIDKLSIPRLINEARAQESDYMKHIAPYTGELGKLVHSAAEAKDAFRPATRSHRRIR